jgi:lipoyl(octanoyl) transferase
MRMATRSTSDVRPESPGVTVAGGGGAPPEQSPLRVEDLGPTAYREAWDLQKEVFASREAGRCPDTLLLTCHDHVYTLGKNTDDNHLLASREELGRAGADVVRVDRGGDITYHGPGQLVGYPILDLRNHHPDIHRYLRDLEAVLIDTLGDFGVEGGREEGYTGVWVSGAKIAAIGVKVSRWITMHGFALNVNTDLKYFDRIIPCGIGHLGVTSMEKILGERVPMRDVVASASKHFARRFNFSPPDGVTGRVRGAERHITHN